MASSFDPEKYTHDSDRAALKALKAIPGFSALMKGFLSIWNERQQRILNMSSRIRLSKKQMGKYYDMLPPICEKLGIAVPELYLEMNVMPNAYTSGDTNPFIVVTSGLLKALPEELIPTILAHECGHIACHHVLYLTMGRIVLRGAGNMISGRSPLGNLLTAPLQMSFYYWMRCSEFSADRAAVLCDGTERKMQEVCMRLAGWDREIDAEVSLDEFLEQTSAYRDMVNDSKWNKMLEYMIMSGASHPLTAVRAAECGIWFRSEGYRDAICCLRPAGEQKRIAPAEEEYGADTAEPGETVIPEGYSLLAPKPGDPEGANVYGRVTTQCDGFVQIYPVVTEKAMGTETQEELIAEARDGLTDSQGLVEVRNGITQSGKPYAWTLIKTLQGTRNVEYGLKMQIGEGENVTEIRGYFLETGTPGFRETTMRSQMKREMQGISEAAFEAGWVQDPYDPAYRQGLLMTEAEKEQYDARFPLHPLTEARKFAAGMAELN